MAETSLTVTHGCDDEDLPRRKTFVTASLAAESGLVSLTLSLGPRQSRRKRRAAAALEVAARSDAPILCFDLGSFDNMMSDKECGALARQLVQIYGYNKKFDVNYGYQSLH